MAGGGSGVQLAGRELANGLHMSGPSPKHLSDAIVQDLPFLKVVSRDRSHAAQRLPGLNTVVLASLGGDPFCFWIEPGLDCSV